MTPTTRLSSSRRSLGICLAFAMAFATVGLVPVAAQAAEPGNAIELHDYERDGRDWSSSGAGADMREVVRTIDADELWYEGYDGSGVDVALIDSGVLPVDALDGSGKVINGPDLSFESQADNLRYLDTNGHGTHLAGIIAGYKRGYDGTGFKGVAPGARIVNLKVADSGGAADVTQVIAAIDWVIENRADNGMNIRVLNLAFGTDGWGQHDPLHFAVERAWQAGIVVVVSAGNDGNASPLRNPANDPYVIAVGASETNGNRDTSNDTIAEFSNCGTAQRHVDVVAPGKSIQSLRAEGSAADVDHPEARVGSDLFKGSGTSQAAAVVSGAVALLIEQRPAITPDELKALLMDTAKPINGSDLCQGAGLIDLEEAMEASTTGAADQDHIRSHGTGSIDATRGSHRVVDEGVTISGDVDIFGNPFDASWTQAAAAGASWSGGVWNGASWSGASWSGASWSGASWSGASWSSKSWSGASWSGGSWSGGSWSGSSWSGNVWLGLSWD